MECRFSLRLEGDNNETNEDVDHEEGDDDQVDKVEEEDIRTVVLLGSNISFVGVDGDIQDSKHRNVRSKEIEINQFLQEQHKISLRLHFDCH